MISVPALKNNLCRSYLCIEEIREGQVQFPGYLSSCFPGSFGIRSGLGHTFLDDLGENAPSLECRAATDGPHLLVTYRSSCDFFCRLDRL